MRFPRKGVPPFLGMTVWGMAVLPTLGMTMRGVTVLPTLGRTECCYRGTLNFVIADALDGQS